MRFRYYLRQYPVTISLIAVTVLIYLIEVMTGGSTQTLVLYRMGALTRDTVQMGEWWRLITPIFLHIGFEHLLFNMFTLLVFGFYIEPFLGSWRFFGVYLLGGIYGNLVSFAFQSSNTISAGASSAIFALFGVFVLMRRSLINHSQYRYLSGQILGLAAFNFIFDIIDNFNGGSIDLLAHLGGLVGGYLLSVLFGSPQAENYRLWQRLLAAAAFLVSGLALYLYGMGRGIV